jgi:hypothetical protein
MVLGRFSQREHLICNVWLHDVCAALACGKANFLWRSPMSGLWFIPVALSTVD